MLIMAKCQVSTMKCSVVILNWNGEKTLRQFLPSVLAHTQLPDVEVVVADNGSTDDSLGYLRTQPMVSLLDIIMPLSKWMLNIQCCSIQMWR